MWSVARRAVCGSRRVHPSVVAAAFSSFDQSKEEKLASQVKKWQQQKPEDKAKFLSIQVDRSTLKQPGDALASNSPVDLPQDKSKENALVHVLRSMIEVKGPLTVAEFMTRALSHPDHGYYMKKDVFGSQGDFTTAPEISQMFGELIAVWCVATWQQMGMPSHVKVVEMGPGRGSLMSDFLRAAKSFPPFYNAIEIHMVDVSPAMQKIQQTTLKCEPIDDKTAPENTMRLPDNGPTVRWHTDFANVPHGPSLMIAQELFDALPVHQFEYTERGWCERLVDIDFEDGGDHFRFVLSPGPTPATRVYIGREKLFDPSAALSHVAETHISDKIEISPVSIALVQDMAKRISQSGGGALIVDYGYDHPSELSLRGIKNHKFVSVLREPGDVDLSIDVDFATLRRFATGEPKVKSSGPVGQGTFLKNMGIEHRLAMLLQNTESEKVQQDLFSSYERLVEPEQMGTIFKAMALTHEDIGQPVGFEELPTEPTEP
ncbi:Protoporphyrinogen oxidase [Phytophthora palmivora]|uniref:Protein arginine methyltransferase NDUFAF7 n=1 Tax=Phytophthora palmivora TaxID=4796 RepID=A0A2P4Y005_9STRA|nr:Protoporphyrinogen oxidase [Phytophthora palmivora]